MPTKRIKQTDLTPFSEILCSKCGITKLGLEFYPRGGNKLGYHRFCKKCTLDWAKIYVKENADWINEKNRIRHTNLRKKVIDGYGSKCVCCNEAEYQFLTIDHILNDGYKRRKQDVEFGTRFYVKLIKLNFPKDKYQLLCRNCNYGKYSNGGACPHTGIKG